MCAIEGCENEHVNFRGWCGKHYKKWQVYGDPKAGRENKRKAGEGTITPDGYIKIQNNKKLTLEHRIVIEKALGHEIPKGADTHHVDGKRANNINSNLVLCDSAAYHNFLHQRTRAYKACGHAGWRKCVFCKEYDNPENNMWISNKSAKAFHRECANVNAKKYRKLLKKGGTLGDAKEV